MWPETAIFQILDFLPELADHVVDAAGVAHILEKLRDARLAVLFEIRYVVITAKPLILAPTHSGSNCLNFYLISFFYFFETWIEFYLQPPIQAHDI